MPQLGESACRYMYMLLRVTGLVSSCVPWSFIWKESNRLPRHFSQLPQFVIGQGTVLVAPCGLHMPSCPYNPSKLTTPRGITCCYILTCTWIALTPSWGAAGVASSARLATWPPAGARAAPGASTGCVLRSTTRYCKRSATGSFCTLLSWPAVASFLSWGCLRHVFDMSAQAAFHNSTRRGAINVTC